MNRGDRRFQRTEDAIENALLALMGKMDYHDITVKRILSEANYSGNAFYSHYHNKDDCLKHLLDKQIALYISNFRQAACAPFTKNNESNRDYIIVYKYFKHIYEKKDFYKILLNDDSLHEFKAYFYEQLLKQLSMNLIVKNCGKIDGELYIYFFTLGLFGCIKYWAQEDFKYTPEYITGQFFLFRNMTGNNIVVNDLPKSNLNGS